MQQRSWNPRCVSLLRIEIVKQATPTGQVQGIRFFSNTIEPNHRFCGP